MATPRKITTPRRKAQEASRLPYLGYIRVSRIGGRSASDGYISKPEQRREVGRLATEYGVELGEVLIEENVSGGSTDRPQFQRALDLIREGKAGGIIVKTLDRFSRNTIDGLTILEEIESHGARLIPGDGPITVATADAKTMATMRFAICDRELGTKREGFARTVERAVAENGVHLGIAYGYMRGDGKRLVPNPDEAAVVVRMFERRAAGAGWVTIARELNDDGVLPRPYRRALLDSEGDRMDEWETVQGQWTHKTVRAMVSNEVYLGVAFNGDHRYEDAHEALVSRKLWNVANAVSVAKRAKHPGRKGGETYLLTGLVRCANCGRVMVHTRRNDSKTGTTLRYYVCRGGSTPSADGLCAAPSSVPAEALERIVYDQFLADAVSIDELDTVLDDEDVARTASALQDAEAAFAAAFDRSTSMQNVTERERGLIEQNLDAKRDALAVAELAHERAITASRGIVFPMPVNELVRDFPNMPVEEQRHLLGLSMRCVVVRRARVWREDVALRALVVNNADVPVGANLIAHVVALAWDESEPRVDAV